VIPLIGYAGMLVGCGTGIVVRQWGAAGIGTTILSGFAAGLAVELALIILTGVQV
jgi:hypothetical protein